MATANPHLLTAESRALLDARNQAVRRAAQTRRVFERMAAEVRGIDTKLDAAERARASHNWPFGQLTEQQMRQRAAQERAMRAGRLAAWPEALL